MPSEDGAASSKTHISEIKNRSQQECHRYCANTSSVWNAFGMPLEDGAAKLIQHNGLSAAW
jgi:hypothetical protein